MDDIFSDLSNNHRLGWDRSDMGALLAGFPEQCRRAVEIGSGFEAEPWRGPCRSLIVCGMGGSAIAGDVLASWSPEGLNLPVIVHRNYDLPPWAGPQDLVVASSYSGETEETLSSYASARERGCRILAISTGGELERRCQKDGVPLLKIPGGMPPRCAFGYSFLSLAYGLFRLGMYQIDPGQIAAAIEAVERLAAQCHWEAPEQSNPAKQVARRLQGTIPVIYASADRLGPAARRWANQINENAKQPGYYALQPELGHNEIVGWELAEGPAGSMSVVMLRDPEDHGRIALRSQAVAEILGTRPRDIVHLSGQGQGRLARMLYLIHLGDWTSYYLAWLNRTDPTPIPPIIKLKNILKGAK